MFWLAFILPPFLYANSYPVRSKTLQQPSNLRTAVEIRRRLFHEAP
jgi:hypothetical protein